MLFFLILGGDLRLHDRQNRTPRDWANMQPNNEAKLATLALIESFLQIEMKGSLDLNSTYDSRNVLGTGFGKVTFPFINS